MKATIAQAAFILVNEIAHTDPMELPRVDYDAPNECKFCHDDRCESSFEEWLKEDALGVSGHDKTCLWVRANKIMRDLP